MDNSINAVHADAAVAVAVAVAVGAAATVMANAAAADTEWRVGRAGAATADCRNNCVCVSWSCRECPRVPEQPVPAHCPTECEYPWLNRFCWAKPYLFRAVALPVRCALLYCAAIWPTAAQRSAVQRAEIMQNGKNGMQTWHKSIENLYVPPKWTVSVCQRRQRQGNIVRSHFAWHSKRHFGVFYIFCTVLIA